MKTVSDVIQAFGGPTAFSKVIGKRPSTASEMKRNRSIPVAYWPKVIAAAAKLKIEGITADDLVRIHAGETPPPASTSEMARGAA
jgi:hypothetical protein